MSEINYNPDVLTCLANLSNDEVFTPPQLVNQMLDMLPKELWSDKDAKFLDPFTKSGVFLREITARLVKGLEREIPDLQTRLDHILKNQIYGIAITELTSLLSKRSLYCSKTANGKYSVCDKFNGENGNILFEKQEHTWKNGNCVYCGASKEVYDRSKDLESHAYKFIHTNKPEEVFNMKFDVVIGNPPYQLSSNSSGIQATPLYHKFVEQAIKLNPRFLTMIIPSRWFSGGMGMDDFRNAMLNDKRLRVLHDYPKSRDCFSGVDIAGGVCYFLWDRDHKGDCAVTTHIKDAAISRTRKLNEFDIFIRDNVGVDVVHKVALFKEIPMSNKVYPISPFGLATSARGKKTTFPGNVILVSSSGKSYIKKEDIVKNKELIDTYKVSIGQLNPDRAGVNNASDGKMNVVTKVSIYKPNEVMTATYLLLDHFPDLTKAQNCADYLKTKFARFLVSLTLTSMHITKNSFRFVPVQDFNQEWTDQKLFKKYKLSVNEIKYIESIIRSM